MSTEAQKLELITWIASLDDQAIVEKVYLQVKKTLGLKRRQPPAPAMASGVTSEAIELLEDITDAYRATDEPDIDPNQIIAERTVYYGRR
jgi:hypothetical protein